MNNCKQDLKVASIEYMPRLMWGFGYAFNMPPDER